MFTEKPDFAIGGINAWRTLTRDEWNYLVEEREMKYGKPRYTFNKDNYTYQLEGKTYYGMFIYPDDYNGNEVGDGEIDRVGAVPQYAVGHHYGVIVCM